MAVTHKLYNVWCFKKNDMAWNNLGIIWRKFLIFCITLQLNAYFIPRHILQFIIMFLDYHYLQMLFYNNNNQNNYKSHYRLRHFHDISITCHFNGFREYTRIEACISHLITHDIQNILLPDLHCIIRGIMNFGSSGIQ